MHYRHLSSFLLLCLVLVTTCKPGQDLAGRYKAVDPRGERTTLLLELRGDGRGAWKVDHENVSFTWEERGGEVWLHSKFGGVVAGKVGKNGSIEISLPGTGTFRFDKVEQ